MGHKGQLGTRGKEKLKKRVNSQRMFLFFLLFHLWWRKWEDRVVFGRVWLLNSDYIELFLSLRRASNLPHPCKNIWEGHDSDYITFLISCTQHSAPRRKALQLLVQEMVFCLSEEEKATYFCIGRMLGCDGGIMSCLLKVFRGCAFRTEAGKKR